MDVCNLENQNQQPVLDWRPVQSFPRLPPSDSWDRPHLPCDPKRGEAEQIMGWMDGWKTNIMLQCRPKKCLHEIELLTSRKCLK